MSFDAIITLIVTVAMVGSMAANLAAPDLVLTLGLLVFLAFGILEPTEALIGFANPAVPTVAALFVLAAGIRETGALDWFTERWLGRPRSLVSAQLRLMAPVSTLSAFLNNTPIVAMMVPVVEDWTRRTGLNASRLFIPLSYAAILGGTCTLIGTSTNLVVAGLAEQHAPNFEIGLFDIAILGVPATLLGIAYVVFFSRVLLPDRQRPGQASLENVREYTVAMRVESDSAVVGQTIENAGLRHLPGLFLVEIERNGHLMPAVDPSVELRADDRLLFAGIVDSVVDLRKIRGLMPATDQVEKLEGRPERNLVEAVVAAQSWLVGKSVRAARFRSVFNAAIIAVHRQGERIRSKVGDIVLKPGDTILLEAHPNFVRNHRHDTAFALVSEVRGSTQRKHEKAGVALAILAAVVVTNILGVFDLMTAALIGACAMVLSRCLKGFEARDALDLRVLITIGAAFGIGAALDSTGLSATLGGLLVDATRPLGANGFVLGLYISTALLTEMISNNAAAALMFPIAVSAATSLAIPHFPIVLVLMVAASASFSTPIGYQTNLMVYGPGGYRFGDFVRFGLPLQILVGTLTTAITVLVLM